MTTPITYLAIDAEAMHEGTFYKVSKYGISQYINGDYLGLLPRGESCPLTYAGHELIAFTRAQAKKILPACCV